MKLQFLGTAAAEGFPALFCECDTCQRARRAGGKDLRFRSGFLVNDTVMIDLCPDVMALQQRMGIRLAAVRDLFITHSHSDHIDVEELCMRRDPVFCQPPDPRPMNVYMNAMAKSRLDDYVPHEHEHYARYLNLTVLEYFKPYTTENGLTLTHLPANHKPNENAGFYVITDGEKTAVYAHDTGVFPAESMAYLKTLSIDFITLDCTYGPNSNRDGHMGIPQNREMVAELRAAGALKEDAVVVINHFSHNGGMLYDELCEAVAPDGFLVSFDGMTVEI